MKVNEGSAFLLSYRNEARAFGMATQSKSFVDDGANTLGGFTNQRSASRGNNILVSSCQEDKRAEIETETQSVLKLVWSQQTKQTPDKTDRKVEMKDRWIMDVTFFYFNFEVLMESLLWVAINLATETTHNSILASHRSSNSFSILMLQGLNRHRNKSTK